MRIAALADLHLVSKKPKTGFDKAGLNNKLEIIQSKLVELGDEAGLYKQYFDPSLKPSTQLDKFSDVLPLIARKINESEVDLVVFNGDIFDVSDKPNRDTGIHDDVYEAIYQFVNLIKPPVFFLPGNTDISSKGNLHADLTKLDGLNDFGKDKLKNDLGKIALVFSRQGNFALKMEDCSIFGLNSVGVRRLGLSQSENPNFLYKFIKEDSKHSIPVVLFTHHPPFRVLPREVTDILGAGFPSQQWILTQLHGYSSDTNQPTMVVSGHCHQKLDTYNGHVREICLLPMLKKLEGDDSFNIGSLIELKGDEFSVSDLKI